MSASAAFSASNVSLLSLKGILTTQPNRSPIRLNIHRIAHKPVFDFQCGSQTAPTCRVDLHRIPVIGLNTDRSTLYIKELNRNNLCILTTRTMTDQIEFNLFRCLIRRIQIEHTRSNPGIRTAHCREVDQRQLYPLGSVPLTTGKQRALSGSITQCDLLSNFRSSTSGRLSGLSASYRVFP